MMHLRKILGMTPCQSSSPEPHLSSIEKREEGKKDKCKESSSLSVGPFAKSDWLRRLVRQTINIESSRHTCNNIHTNPNNARLNVYNDTLSKLPGRKAKKNWYKGKFVVGAKTLFISISLKLGLWNKQVFTWKLTTSLQEDWLRQRRYLRQGKTARSLL